MPHAPSAVEAFEAIPVHLAVVDGDLSVSMVNRSWRETLPLDPRHRSFEALFPGACEFSLETLRNALTGVFEDGANSDTTLLPLSGGTFEQLPLSVEVYRLQTEEPLLLLVAIVANAGSTPESPVDVELILNSITERIIFQDRDMRIIWANRIALEEVGMCDVDEILGLHCYELWSDGVGICDGCPVLLGFREKREVSIEHTHEDEGRAWSIRAFPVFSRDGERVIGGVETATEITELRRAEEALRESEYWHRTTLEGIRDGVIATDQNGSIIISNPSAAKMTGWSEAHAHGKDIRKVTQFVDGRSRREISHPFDAVMENGKRGALSGETMLVNRDGRLVPVEARGIPLCNDEDDARAFILVLRDVSQKRRSDRNLRSKERQYRTLAENAPDVITRFDRRIRMIFGNEALSTIAGVAPAMANGRTPREMDIDEELARAWEESLRDCLYHKKQVTRNVILGGGSSRRTLVIEALPEFDEDDTVQTLLSIIRDASPIDRIARNLADKNRMLLTMNEAVAKFVEHRGDDAIYEVIPRYLRKLTGARLSFICSVDQENLALKMEALSTPEEVRECLREAFDSEMEELNWTMDPVAFEGIQRGILLPLKDLAELTGESISRDAAARIQEDLDLGEIFAIGLSADGRILGVMGLVMPAGVSLKNQTMVEAYSRVVSGTLLMREMEEALR
ncbi:MAG: PAS domain-containing protein, partial [Bacillota bacterium]